MHSTPEVVKTSFLANVASSIQDAKERWYFWALCWFFARGIMVMAYSLSWLYGPSIAFDLFLRAVLEVGLWLLGFYLIWRSIRCIRLMERKILPAIGLFILVSVQVFLVRGFWLTVDHPLELMRGEDRLGSIEIRVAESGEIAWISGFFGNGSNNKLRELIAQHPNLETLVITSQGGRIKEVERSADATRELAVHVPDYCLSACTTFLFTAKHSSIDTRAAIGFHRPGFDGKAGMMQQLSGAVLYYRLATSHGVPLSFITQVLKVPFWSMWYPEFNELVRSRVVHSISDIGALRNVSLSTADGIDQALGLLQYEDLPALVVKHRPEEYKRMQAEYREELIDHPAASISEMRTGLHERLAPVLARSLLAPNAVQVRRWYAEMTRSKLIDTDGVLHNLESCTSARENIRLDFVTAEPRHKERLMRVFTKALEEHTDGTVRDASSAAVEPMFQQLGYVARQAIQSGEVESDDWCRARAQWFQELRYAPGTISDDWLAYYISSVLGTMVISEQQLFQPQT